MHHETAPPTDARGEVITLVLPDVSTTLERLMTIQTSFASRTQTIGAWVKEHGDAIKMNLELTRGRSDEGDLEVLRIFLRELLMSSISGEGGQRIAHSLSAIIKTKSDLTQANYERVLKESRYRWNEGQGSNVMSAVVAYFRDVLDWNWQAYLGNAASIDATQSNFSDDPLLKIKHVGQKVRDLALSNFDSNYAAFDLHVIRVASRIGLIAYGWELTTDAAIEFGTNPSDERNYLFFRRLLIKLASLSGGRFTPVDLDRTFWHLGRHICGKTTQCAICPIRDVCLTGKRRCF